MGNDPAQRREVTSDQSVSPRLSDDPVAVLHRAVEMAITDLRRGTGSQARGGLENMLSGFTDRVGAVRERLEVLAAAQPQGALPVALGHLGNAFAHAAKGDVDATRAALITAHATLFLAGGDTEDAEAADADTQSWRF